MDGLDPNLRVSAFRQIFQNKKVLKRLLLNFGRDFRLSYHLPGLAEQFPLLEHLTLENFDANLSDLGEFKALQSLRLINRWIVEVNINFYRSMVKRYSDRLQKLQLISVRVRNEQVQHILALRQLKALDCDNWPAPSISELGKLTELECLALDCIEEPHVNSSRQLLSVVTSCPKLRHMKFGKRWEMSTIDVDGFLTNVRETISNREKELLITFPFFKTSSREKV